MTFVRTALAAGAALTLGGSAARAQTDYRNLDDGRPVATEDAYVIERFAFELVAPYRFEAGAAGSDIHALGPELSYGVLPNMQVGLETALAAADQGIDTEWGVGALEVSALYNFNTESAGLPALSMRAELQAPVGSLGGDVWRATFSGIATRAFGRFRLHLNAARSVGSETGLSALDAAPRWGYGIAGDYTLLRSSLLLVGETVVRRAVAGARVEVNAAAGFRWQWTPTLVLDAGVARRLRSDAGPDLGLTIGLTHAFAVKGLMPLTASSRRPL
ncbi:MAG TPA: hypothetical protein VFM14_07555 [Gemmatimonadales bacterium]|nr:hypothetical protein [Gemmatimonadales bacterium]